MNITKELLLENEELLEGIEARQLSLNTLSTYLSELESQLALLFAASPDIIVFLDDQSNILKISDAAYTLLGYKREEMVGKPLWDFISIADIDQAKQHLLDVQRQKIVCYNQQRYLINYWVAKTGALVKLAWRFSLYDEREHQTIGVATDVSYMGQNERLNVKLFERAINLATDGIVITDAYHYDNAMIYINPAFERLTGYTQKEMIGKNCRFLQTETCANSRAITMLRECVRSLKGCSVLLENKRKDNTIFYNHLTISTVVENGAVTNYIGICKDVTDKIGVDYDWSPNTERGFCLIP